MSNAGLPVEFGRAVDDSGTKNRHQIFSLDYDCNTSLYVLHYSVCSPDLVLSPDEILPPDFIENLSKDIIGNPENTKAAARDFSKFMQKMRRGLPKAKGFKPEKLTSAVTYDVSFNDAYDIKGFNYRATQSVMTDAMTNNEAADRIENKFDDDQLKIWHDFALHTLQNRFYEGVYKEKLNFTTVTDITADVIKQEIHKMARRNKIDCVCRYSPFEKPLDIHPDKIPRKDKVKSTFYQYGSVLGDYRGRIKPIDDMGNKIVVSATASRNSIDAYNIIVLKEFNKNDATNPFPVGTSYAFAHYRDQLNKIRRDRLRAA